MMSLSEVKALLERHAEIETSPLIVGHVEQPSKDGDVYSFAGFFDDAKEELRRTLGVCINPGEADVPVLARLRDVHCQRVLAIVEIDSPLGRSELLALGFQKLADDKDKTLYACSVELNDRPREWNNANRWANPENFDKYRW